MKYQFKNIGPIKSAELELGGLTVIAGANNTGKTYIAHSLYSFQRYLLLRAKDKTLFRRVFEGEDNDVKLSFGKAGVVGGSIDVAVATKMINQFIEDTHMRFLRDSISSRLNMSLRKISRAVVSGEFSDENMVIPAKIERKKNVGIFDDEILPLKREGDSLVFSLTLSGKIIREIKEIREIGGFGGGLIDALKLYVKANLVRSLIGIALGSSTRPFILTAERFGISIFLKELDFSKSRFVEAMQKNTDSKYEGEDEKQVSSRFYTLSDSSARYSQPIKDNIDYTRHLDNAVKRSSELGGAKLFNDIEKMMKGSYKYENNSVIFVPFRQVKGGGTSSVKGSVELPLHEASSSVCGLSDMYFYLKHTAKKNQLMIVDEPESYLDTKNQIRMARLLARCVNAGLRVLITTHSDYIVKEFNNLIMLSYDFSEKAEFLKFYRKEYNNKDFLTKESIRAYACENGGLSSCAIDNRGMDIALFDNTINSINRVSDELDGYLPAEE